MDGTAVTLIWIIYGLLTFASSSAETEVLPCSSLHSDCFAYRPVDEFGCCPLLPGDECPSDSGAQCDEHFGYTCEQGICAGNL